jgi:hypothetical protein
MIIASFSVYSLNFITTAVSKEATNKSCMKKLLILASVFVCTAGAVSAQDSTGQKMNKMDHGKMDHKMKDCVMMKDGKMMVMKDGQKTEMTEDMTLTNGTTVMKDGSVKTSDGKTMTLKNGDWVDMDGKMGSKMSKDKMKSKM